MDTPPPTAHGEELIKSLESLAQVRPDDLAPQIQELERTIDWSTCDGATLDKLSSALDTLGDVAAVSAFQSKILVARDWQDCLASLDDLRAELRQFHIEIEYARERQQILPSDLTPELDVLRKIVNERPAGEDTGTPGKASAVDPFSRFERDASTTIQSLEGRLQPIKASLTMLLLRLDAFAQHADSLMPEAVVTTRAAYGALCVENESLSQDFAKLKEEYLEDKWHAVWRCVQRQVKEVITSLSLTLRRLDGTAFRGTLINSLARALAMKRDHYTVLVPGLLALVDGGIRSMSCRSGEVISGHRELQSKWKAIASEVEQMTRRIDAARSAGIITDDNSESTAPFAKPAAPSTPFRKDTSLLPPRSVSRLSSAAFDSPDARPPWNGGTSVRLSTQLSPTKLPMSRLSAVNCNTPSGNRLARPTLSSMARSVSALPRASLTSPQKRPSVSSGTPTRTKLPAPRASLLRPPSTPRPSSRLSISTPAHVARTQAHSTAAQIAHLSSGTIPATPTRSILKPLKHNTIVACRSSIPLPSPRKAT